MEITTYLGDVRFLEVDLILAGMYEDERPPQGLAGLVDWYLFGQLTDLIRSGRFSGRRGHFALLATQERITPPKFLVVGLGDKGRFVPEGLGELAAGVAESVGYLKVRAAAVEFLGAGAQNAGREAAAKLLLGAFSEGRAGKNIERLLLIPADESEQETVERLLRQG